MAIALKAGHTAPAAITLDAYGERHHMDGCATLLIFFLGERHPAILFHLWAEQK